MFIDAAAIVRNAARLYLEGKPPGSLADRVAAAKIVDLSAARARLRRLPDHRTKQEVGN
jgi:hypothetical protein